MSGKKRPPIRMAKPRLRVLPHTTVHTLPRAHEDPGYLERQRFLNTAQWRATSSAKRAYDPLCQACLLEGVHTPAVDVDHWIAMRDLPRERWTEYANLRSLCERHHTHKTQAELRGDPPPFECAPSTPHPLYG